MLAGYSFQDFELIQSVFLTVNAASVVFNNLNLYATEYRHLQIRFTSRSSTSSVSDTLIQLNGDVQNNYAWHELQGNGSSVASFSFTSQAIMRVATQPANTQTNIYASGIVDILDYSSTAKNTTIRALAGNTSNERRAQFYSGVWLNTAAVNSISIVGSPGNGSRFSLYGIR